jgi:hypothetical protein
LDNKNIKETLKEHFVIKDRKRSIERTNEFRKTVHRKIG